MDGQNEVQDQTVEMIDTGRIDNQGRKIVQIRASDVKIDGYNLRQHIDSEHVSSLSDDMYRDDSDHDGRRQEQPIVITSTGNLRIGEHRTLAARLRQEKSGTTVYLRAVVEERQDEGLILLAHIRENMDSFRRNWSESEKGNAILRLRKLKMKDGQIAKELGISQSAVSNAAKLASEAIKPLQEANSQGLITAAQLREVVSVASKTGPRKKLPVEVQEQIHASILKLKETAKDVKGREFGHSVDEVFGKARLAFDGTAIKSPGRAPKNTTPPVVAEVPVVSPPENVENTPSVPVEASGGGKLSMTPPKPATPLDPRAGLLEMVRDMAQKYELSDIFEALSSQYGLETLEHNLALLACGEVVDDDGEGMKGLVDDDETVEGSHEEE